MEPRKAQSVMARWVGAAAAFLVFAVATTTYADPDLWGHLRFGLDTIHARAIDDIYPYAFTQDRPWVNHEWLAEVQMGGAYLLGGVAGLALLKGALVSLTLWLVWSGLRGVDPAARMLTIGLVIIGTGSVTTTLRPQLWSLLFLSILCSTLINDEPRRRRWLPVLFAAWANVHGGWIVGLGVLGLWAAADGWSRRDRLAEWTVIGVVSVAATLVTPYGVELWRFLLDTVSMSRDVTEWQPLWTLPAMNWLPWVVMVVVAMVMMARPHRHRLPVTAVLTMLAYSSLRVSRIAPLFVGSAAVLLAPSLRRAWPADRGQRSGAISPHAPVAVAVLVIGLVTVGAWRASTSLRCITVVGDWVPKSTAVRLLASAPPGRVVTFFDWGEYAVWHLGPRIKVSFDGTRETVYSERRLAEHDAILAGRPEGLQALESWMAEYVWLPARSVATKDWLSAHGYRIEFDSSDSFVAVRGDLPALVAPPEQLSPLPGRCFPD